MLRARKSGNKTMKKGPNIKIREGIGPKEHIRAINSVVGMALEKGHRIDPAQVARVVGCREEFVTGHAVAEIRKQLIQAGKQNVSAWDYIKGGKPEGGAFR